MSVIAAHRNHPTYWAFLLHRLSGLALAIFLPVHLYVLSMAVAKWVIGGCPSCASSSAARSEARSAPRRKPKPATIIA